MTGDQAQSGASGASNPKSLVRAHMEKLGTNAPLAPPVRNRTPELAPEALAHALESLADQGQRPPCAAEPERWVGDDRAARAEAATECRPCPLLNLCAAVGEAEQWGVWGGTDRSPQPKAAGRPKKEQAA